MITDIADRCGAKTTAVFLSQSQDFIEEGFALEWNKGIEVTFA